MIDALKTVAETRLWNIVNNTGRLYKGDVLESVNLKPQSFIVKIWCEDDLQEGGKLIWRGQITHVPSGTRKHIRALEEISNFITPFLDKMGCTNAG